MHGVLHIHSPCVRGIFMASIARCKRLWIHLSRRVNFGRLVEFFAYRLKFTLIICIVVFGFYFFAITALTLVKVERQIESTDKDWISTAITQRFSVSKHFPSHLRSFPLTCLSWLWDERMKLQPQSLLTASETRRNPSQMGGKAANEKRLLSGIIYVWQ